MDNKKWIALLSAQTDDSTKRCRKNFLNLCQAKTISRMDGEPPGTSYDTDNDHYLQMREYQKLMTQMFVWPVGSSLSLLEMTTVTNSIILAIASWDPTVHPASECKQIESALGDIILKVLKRVLQYLQKETWAPSRTETVENKLMNLVTALSDPLIHFKALDLLGSILLLSCVWCLYRKQRKCLGEMERVLSCIEKLHAMANGDILGETLTDMKIVGLLHDNCVNAANAPTVGDFVHLLLIAFGRPATQQGISVHSWIWLDILLKCEHLISTGDYVDAMKEMEPVLQTQLDPEVKSRLLQVFAKCYYLQGCPQLAIQTYQSALKTEGTNMSILLELSQLYAATDQHDLELECLNLLVKKLTDLEIRGENFNKLCRSLDLADLMASVCNLFPRLGLVSIMHHFAKRCSHLGRFKEAAEQYLSLLQLIQNPKAFGMNSKLTSDDFDPVENCVEEIIVETAESLLSDHQHVHCATLCDDFLPYLTASENLYESTQSQYYLQCENRINRMDGCPLLMDNDDVDQINNSQNSLFSSASQPEEMDKNLEKQTPLKSEFLKSLKSSNSGTPTNILATSWCESMRKCSRKRFRSSETVDSNENNSGTRKTYHESSIQLAVRLFLCRTDAEVAMEGYSEKAMNCLLKAYNLLLDNKCIFKSVDRNPKQPSSKRRRVDIGEEINLKTNEDSQKLEADLQPIDTWSQLMVNVVVRMARLAMKRSKIPSVINSCHLVLQLDSNNTTAHYLNTLVLQERPAQREKAALTWLKERGIDTNISTDELQAVCENKEKRLNELRSGKSVNVSKWWEVSDLHVVTLDIACLHQLLMER